MTASNEPPFQPSPEPSLEDQGATLRALSPIYSALVREFVIETAPCPINDSDGEGFAISPESVEHAAAWFEQIDAKIQVHQLRQFLQTTPLANEAALRHLLLHHLQKTAKSASDRDKTDFLLVQYFSLCAPSGLDDADVDLDYVAQVLEPVLGPQPPELPAWLSSLETIMQSAARCRRLSELLHSGVLEQGRKLKTQNAARYFEPAAMVAFARFSFMIRRIFFRLMQGDLNAIHDGLRELERRGLSSIDCRRAQFSAEEPIARLRMICQSWKVMFHAEYSSGQPLRMLVDLRAAVDDALQNGERKNLLASAAAASANSSGGTQE
jgi:hypothetical protein